MNRGGNHGPLRLVLLSFAAAWLLFWLFPGLLGTWNLKAGDQLFRLRQRCFGNLRIDPAVVHLDVDDASVRSLGASVESGARYESILRILTAARVAAIACDYVFLSASDGMVAATRESGRTYYPVALGPGGAPCPDALAWRPALTRAVRSPAQGVAFATCPELLAVARGAGHITCSPDEDGVHRRVPLLLPVANGLVPSLALRVACGYLSVPPERIVVDPGRSLVLRGAQFPDGRTKDIAIPIDAQCRIIVNFAGRETDTFAHYSLADVLAIARDARRFEQLRDELENAIVIVADIAASKDVGAVPMERAFHLPGLHSNVVNSILTGQFVRELPPWPAAAADLGAAGLLVLAARRIRSGRWFVAATVALLGAFVAFDAGLFLWGHVLANGVRTAFGLVAALVGLTAQKYVRAETQRAFLRARCEHYFAPAVLDKILASRSLLDACEKKRVTVLFSDICGFTPWSATRAPEDVRDTLNAYFQAMTELVFRHEGMVDKYMGDGLMAIFGDPVAHPDHALRAVRAAIDMQRAARELRERWGPEGRIALQIRIGIHTGEAVVGNMGSEQRVDYTAIGPNVNLAERLEANAPAGGILISRAVYDCVQGHVDARAAGRIKAKGFEDEVEVFEIRIDGAPAPAPSGAAPPEA